MDRQQKVALLRESLGQGVDQDFAESVLAAHDWDLQVALSNILGDGGAGAAPPPRQEPVDAEGYRAPMRTGYTDTLIAPLTPAEEHRQRMEREAEETRRLQELQAQAEARRLAEERARQEAQVKMVEEQRVEAERQAQERRRQQKQREVAAAMAAAEAAAAAAAAASGSSCPSAASQPPAFAAAPASPPVFQAPPTPPQAVLQQAVPQAVPQQPVVPEAPPPQAAVPQPQPAQAAKPVDAVVQACVALRKRYKDSDPAGLKACLTTLRTYVGNLAKNPTEPKFQRIPANPAFLKRVAAYEGAVDVLMACGFQQQEGALAVGPEFVKTKGSKLFDALNKLDVMIEQLN